jgi:hypothetical protein
METNEIKTSNDKAIKDLQMRLLTLEESHTGEPSSPFLSLLISWSLALALISFTEISKEKLELEYSLRQQTADLEKLRPECLFYKTSLSESQELMRAKDKERYQLEQDLARSIARREALELQITDKEEVEEYLCHHSSVSSLVLR